MSKKLQISKARRFEGVASQMRAFASEASSVNRIESDSRSNEKCQAGETQAGKCYDCGYFGHFEGDSSCPTEDRTCNSCREFGHFRACCPTKMKRERYGDDDRPRPFKRVRYVQTEDDVCRDFVFRMRSDTVINQEPKGQIMINEIPLTAIIDSGCPVTIVNSSTYGYLIAKGLCERTFIQGSDILLYGFEITRPAMEITDSVEVEVRHRDHKVVERIYIALYGHENLLGKRTAELLKLLQVGQICLSFRM